MKKYSKILAIVVSLLLVLVALAGCGNNTENNGVNNNENKTTKEAIARGVVDENNVYKSEFAGITFKLPEGFKYATDAEIAEMMNIGVDALSEKHDNVEEILEKTALYDMVAQDESTGASVMVMFEKPTLNVNVETYLKNVKKGLESVTEMGYVVSDEIGTEKVGQREYKTLLANIPEYGLTQKYYTEKVDGYFVNILVTYFESTTDLNNLLANFQ